MKSAIEAVFDGDLASKNPDMGKEYWEASKITQIKEDALLELIKDNEKALKAFGEYLDAEGESSGIAVSGFYKEGFRNGFWLAFDVMKEE